MGDSINQSILTEEIFLRKLELKDAEPMLEWLKNPAIYEKMQYNPENQSLERCRRFIEASWEDKENLHYAITNLKHEYLGTVSLKNVNNFHKNAELGIVIHPKMMGCGIGGQALKHIMYKAFQEMKLHKVYLCVRRDNERAVKFYEKYKFKLEGCHREQLFLYGQYRDIYWFALTEEEYVNWCTQWKAR